MSATADNPYAPPCAAPAPPPAEPVARSLDLPAALRRLDEHLADPERVAADRVLAGGRLRRSTAALLLVGVGALVATVAIALATSGDLRLLALPTALIGLVMATLGGLRARQERRVPPRAACTTPETAFAGWLQAIAQGRAGYVVAALAPDARERDTPVPQLAPVVTAHGSYPLVAAEAAALWLGGFARTGREQVRWFSIKRVSTIARDGRVARVEADLLVAGMPAGAYHLGAALLLVTGWLGLIVFIVLWRTRRRLRRLRAPFVLLEGTDGRWYLADAAFGDDVA